MPEKQTSDSLKTDDLSEKEKRLIMSKAVKTNAMRILEREKIEYEPSECDPTVTDGVGVAKLLNRDVSITFKTLVTEGAKKTCFVFVIPVAETLDLKKAAAVCGQKSIAMIKQKELLPLTGYIHGGCSPVGMKKPFPTYIHSSAEGIERISVSGGRVGLQVMLKPSDLIKITNGTFADIIVR